MDTRPDISITEDALAALDATVFRDEVVEPLQVIAKLGQPDDFYHTG